jgi:hypothetical protein
MDAVLEVGFTAATSACHQKPRHTIFHDSELELLYARGILLQRLTSAMAFDTSKYYY